MTYIVVLGLVVVVILVVVLVALGMRASRQAREQDEEWMAEEQQQQQPRRHAPLDEPGDAYGSGYDRRVAGAPLGAPVPVLDTPEPPGRFAEPERPSRFAEQERPAPRGLSRSASRSEPAPPRRGQASEEMEDDDYWATITFDKPKFPWQHDDGRDRPVGDDPLADVGPREEEQHEQAPAAAHDTGPHGYDPGYGLEPGYGNEPAYSENTGYSADPYGADPVDLPVSRHTSGENALPGFPQTGPQPIVPGRGQTGPQPVVPGRDSGPQQLPDPLGLPDPLAPAARDWGTGGRDRDWDSGSRDRDWDSGALPRRNGAAAAHPSAEATQAFSLDSIGNNGYSTPPAPQSPLSPPAPQPAAASAATHDSDGHRLPTVDELLQRIQTDRARTAAAESPSSYGSDPLSDPLGGGSSWSSSSSASSSYDPDPLSGTGPYPSAGYRSSGGFQSDGYPSAPAVGPRSTEPARYDDSLGSFGGGQNSYGGSFGGGQSEGSGEPSRYGDFSGSSYSGSDSSSGYGAPGTNGYAYGNPEAASGYGGSPYGRDQQPTPNGSNSSDDWDNYRDFRR